jgi:Uma2 family endonuclease
MSSITSTMSVSEYLATSFKPRCEYIDGVLRQKSMPTKLHALIQFLLVTLLRKQGFEALAELTVRVSASNFLVPDIVADPQIEDPYPTRPVSLCVEVLSPEDRLSAAFAKCEEYHAWGVPYCWVIDPLKQTAWEYHANTDPIRIGRGGQLHAGDLSAPLGEVFADQPK